MRFDFFSIPPTENFFPLPSRPGLALGRGCGPLGLAFYFHHLPAQSTEDAFFLFLFQSCRPQ